MLRHFLPGFSLVLARIVLHPPALVERLPIGRQVAAKPGRARVVRVGGQLLIQQGGEIVQSVRLLVHAPIMRACGGVGATQVVGICA